MHQGNDRMLKPEYAKDHRKFPVVPETTIITTDIWPVLRIEEKLSPAKNGDVRPAEHWTSPVET